MWASATFRKGGENTIRFNQVFSDERTELSQLGHVMSTSRAAGLRTRARRLLVGIHTGLYRRVWGMDIGQECVISLKARLDKTNPHGVHIGRYTSIALDVVVLSHDFVRNQWRDTWIGERCHIGAGAIICPGVRIGNGCVVAPGSVVLTDVPDGCVVVGNPARIVERGITVGKWGIRFVDIAC
jgi:acetyltransferase-like isoleucine patch superfamily enzyme